MRPAWLFLFFLLILPSIAHSESYPETLAEKGVAMGLHERREWHVLLHYKPALIKGVESLVDDPDFFNSNTGKTDPASELRETVKAFFKTEPSGDAHAQCRFIARFNWLKKELSIDESRLPLQECKGFDEFHKSINPRSAVLVFPVSHINSPASMFGHTLLRIDSDKESKLFSWAVNYSAKTGETNGIFFAVKGIFGYYEGFFGVLPYYEKIKEYSNLENRDIWEYNLELTPEEVEKMMLHLWELKDVYTYYYFFDENCSYNLLLVLEAARPELDFLKDLPPWVIPMDTIRALSNSGVSQKAAEYRPSKAARIKHLEKLVSPALKTAALRTAVEGPKVEIWEDNSWPVEKKALALELASEYIQYRYAKKMITKEEYTKLLLDVLGKRSGLGRFEAKDPEPPSGPDSAHGPARINVGIGAKASSSFLSLSIRPANHSLTDPDAGYLPGAAITFMEGEARYYFDDNRLSLNRLTLVEIDSVSPRDDFFKPISWSVSAAVEREETREKEYRTVARLSGGPGLSYAFSRNGLLYAFLEPAIKIGSGLDEGYSLGIGPRAGIIKPLSDRWKARLEFSAEAFGPGDEHTVVSAELDQTYSLSRDSALNLNLKRERFEGFYSNEIVAGASLYF